MVIGCGGRAGGLEGWRRVSECERRASGGAKGAKEGLAEGQWMREEG